MDSTNPEPAPEAIAETPTPTSESLRLEALRSYRILDTPSEPAFDDITRIAALICGTPMALVSLVDHDRQWFKSRVGLEAPQTPRTSSICAHAIAQDALFVVEDTLEDPRFVRNPLVTGDPHLRFYAGALLKTSDGLPLGTVCVLDTQPRRLSEAQREALTALARQAMAQLELRRTLAYAQEAAHYRGRLMAIAGHDLKTPLRAASYTIEKVRRSVEPPLAAQLESAKQSLAGIAKDFEQLATMAAAGGSGTSPRMTEFPIAQVLAPVLETWRRQAEQRGLALHAVHTDLRVRSHPTLLATVIGNLVGNAIKYTATGKVLVGCRRRGDQVLLEVLDTGQGMDAQTTHEVFNAFRQGDPASDGLGLGLWIVSRTAQTLGSEVRLTTHPGRGTRFTVSMARA
ncbi:GAF domain-containing sensor histidine kinase [Pseudoxanthomonas sp. JBR18]|uniref:sensor histidine kinase n=1 Tax=Pseudoxanthomonas sp. JBR18 TaxID=2969308 RepID=UPI0023052D4A|nr:GAF domain-containing sensor histidine kinase [Pseudoxanthomonas sp. JBR18]WCE05023.1 GAF domain-containing sensor histidine kinase [Pseudoxanthomonas sp. JBR18]